MLCGSIKGSAETCLYILHSITARVNWKVLGILFTKEINMGERLKEALALIINEVSDETYEMFQKILQLNTEINYMDWNDWNEYKEDKSENGLLNYMRELFVD